MPTYKVESVDGRSYTIATDSIERAVQSVRDIGMIHMSNITKIAVVERCGNEWVDK